MLKFIMAAPLALALITQPCMAQTAPAPVNQEASSLTSQIDPVRLAAARRVLAANGSARTFALVIDRLVPDIMHTIAQGRGLNSSQERTATQLLQTEMQSSSQDFMDMTAAIYAQHMSTEDLTALAEFYESPVGQRYIGVLPDITK